MSNPIPPSPLLRALSLGAVVLLAGGHVLIENVAVRPEFQGRGFGVRLLTLAEELAAASGLAGTRLYTNKLFEVNIRLYASLGYQIEREEPINGAVRVHMRKVRA